MENKKSSGTNWIMALGLAAIGIALGAAGIYVGDTDDAPGAALIGIVLMIALVVFAVRTARRKPVERL
jgi:peptidoglycan/LPS O-acetylase OafA/YrhL